MAEHVCPWWVGYLMVSPLRTLVQSPERILGEHLEEGMTVLDLGSGMGFFSLPMARMVGPSGRVVCVDLQDRMLQSLRSRATKAGLSERIETRRCSAEDHAIGELAGSVDFVLAFAMVHEVPDQEACLEQIREVLAPGGRLLLSEPKGHVSDEDFDRCLVLAGELGFVTVGRPSIRRGLTSLLEKAA